MMETRGHAVVTRRSQFDQHVDGVCCVSGCMDFLPVCSIAMWVGGVCRCSEVTGLVRGASNSP